MTLRPILVGLILISGYSANALPGFVQMLTKYYPSEKPQCLTCHSVSKGEKPHNTNVNKRGLSFYDEVRLKEKMRNDNLQRLTSRVAKSDFVIFGDTRTNDNVHQTIVSQICALGPKAVFHTGDVVAKGSSNSLWNSAIEIENCLIQAKILYPTCGNHEGGSCLNNPFRQKLGNQKQFYTVDVGPFTFIALDSYSPNQAQLDWLKQLPVGKKYIPFYHYVPYPTIAGHGASSYVLENFLPEFKRLGVKVAFNGHNHGYDRAVVDNVTYVTAGGGGAPLYACGSDQDYTKFCVSDNTFVKCAIVGTSISCDAVATDNSVYDHFEVSY